MKEFVRQYYKIALGIFFVALGIVGLFLPFLQGILFLAIGVTLLVRHSSVFRRLWLRLGQRYPRLLTLIKVSEKTESSS